MTAKDFVERYWNIPVAALTPEGMPFRCGISINSYLIATQKNIADIQSKQQQVIGKARDKKIAIPNATATRLRLGKGSPDDMATILNAGVQSGALKADPTFLQKWADDNLGVDCTGFAIAYLVELGVLAWNPTFNGGAGCPWIYQNIAKKNWQTTKYAAEPELWSVGDMKPDDFILWMKSGGGPETKSPGHIVVVYEVGSTDLQCAESSGASDGKGHKGPQLSTKQLGRVVEGGGKKWWAHGTGVVVVRPSGG